MAAFYIGIRQRRGSSKAAPSHITFGKNIPIGPILILLACFGSCGREAPRLRPISHARFEQFVAQTGYVTDAEKYGWSFRQLNVYEFVVVEGADWRRPDGVHPPASGEMPVTQVSYRDAMAYCQWAGARLPTYEEYWEMVAGDLRNVVTDNRWPISPVGEVNVVGNVWDLTATVQQDSVRLAGGSLYCAEKTCNGTSRQRRLFVDLATGNTHIGFSVVE